MKDTINGPVVPAVIPQSVEHLKEMLSQLSFVHEIQIDVVDGQFVPFTSWPYQPLGTPKDVAPLLAPFTVEVDLMVANPAEAARHWYEAGAEMLVFHIESISLEDFAAVTNQLRGCTIGVSASNAVPLDTVFPYAQLADYFQLMGIRDIGSQGQPFDEAVLTRIEAVHEAYPEKQISIDGSVNAESLGRLKAAGADRFVAGSAILQAETPQAGYEALMAVYRGQ